MRTRICVLLALGMCAPLLAQQEHLVQQVTIAIQLTSARWMRGAQGPPRMGPRQPSAADIPMTVLDANLKLTSAQKTKVSKIQDKMQQEFREMMPQPGDPADGPPDMEAMRSRFEKLKALREDAARQIEAALTATQRKALVTLIQDVELFRSAGLPPELIGDLKLTASQKKRLSDLVTEAREKMEQRLQDSQQQGGFDAMRSAFMAMRQETYEKALTVLTPEQKEKTVKFVKEHPQRGPGGFGPGGGFGPPPDGPPPGGPPPAEDV